MSKNRCDKEVYKNGTTIGVIAAAGAPIIEGIVEVIRRDVPKGTRVDWFYMGGRGVIRVIGDVKEARNALGRCVLIDYLICGERRADQETVSG